MSTRPHSRSLSREDKRERSQSRREKEENLFETNWGFAEERDRELRGANPNWTPPVPAWKPLPSAPDQYEVHYFGFVRSRPRKVTQRTHAGTTYTRLVGGKILKIRVERDQRGSKRPRKMVTLKFSGRSRPVPVAELVLETFDSPRAGREISYKNGATSNCHILNLEWNQMTPATLLISRNFPSLAKQLGIEEDSLAVLRKRTRKERQYRERTPGTREFEAKRKFERELKDEIAKREGWLF